jgi:hypothetical protein
MKRENSVLGWLLAVAIPVPLFLSAPSLVIAQTDGGNQPFIGLWKLNVEKSKAPPGVHIPPGFTVYRQYQDEGDGWIFETATTIIPSRGPQFLFTAARFDGKPYPDYWAESLGNFVRRGARPPQTVTFTRGNAHQIRWADTRNGREVAGGTETVSPDGNTMTMTTNVPGQKVESVQVFDRVSGPNPGASSHG